MDSFRIDSHKLIYHIPRVYRWLQGKDIYPIYIEIGLCGGCNQRCTFCAFDYLKYKPYILDEKCLNNFISSAGRNGVKSIMYAGEGEPLLHKRVAEIVCFTRKNNIDVAITSNAVMFSKNLAERCLPYLSWFRASINAGTPQMYSLIHKANSQDFNTVLNNLKETVRIRNKKRYSCTIGVQFLLISQNYSEVTVLAHKIKDLGVDYLIIKPYSQHPQSRNKISYKFYYKDFFYLKEELEKISTNSFQIIFRQHSMEKLKEEIPYKHCLGLPFVSFITASGDVYPCSMFFGRKDFIFGNICKGSFKEIWEGKKRTRIMDMIYKKWDTRKCRKACRLDEINRYLWELRNPSNHVNFI